MSYRDAYEEGYDAFTYGEMWHANPFDQYTEPEEWSAWNRGFDDAEMKFLDDTGDFPEEESDDEEGHL